jgi:antirestriction protein ArdC
VIFSAASHAQRAADFLHRLQNAVPFKPAPREAGHGARQQQKCAAHNF